MGSNRHAVTTLVLALAGCAFAQQTAPMSRAASERDAMESERKQDPQRDNGKPASRERPAPLPPPEVLCNRTRFGPGVIGGLDISINREWVAAGEGDKPSGAVASDGVGVYCLSSITVPPDGWRVDAIAIYTNAPSKPDEWVKVSRARLSVFAKKGELPAAEDDPRFGREVEVTVRRIEKGAAAVYEVRASGLSLALAAGEHWLGLTPLYSTSNGSATHLRAHFVRDARFDDVGRAPDASRPERRNWTANCPAGVHHSIRIEGWRVPRGQVVEWRAEEPKDVRQLYLRWRTFDPIADPPKVPEELAAAGDSRLWIAQCRQTVDQPARDQLTRAGATLLRYLPDDAYLVRLAPDSVEAVRQLPAVRWVGPYHPAYRIDPDVSPEWPQLIGRRAEPKGSRFVRVYLFDRDDAAKDLVAQAIREAGGRVVFRSPRGFYLAANVPLDRLAAVARCEAVCAIERRFGGFEHQQGPQEGEDALITLF